MLQENGIDVCITKGQFEREVLKSLGKTHQQLDLRI